MLSSICSSSFVVTTIVYWSCCVATLVHLILLLVLAVLEIYVNFTCSDHILDATNTGNRFAQLLCVLYGSAMSCMIIILLLFARTTE